MRKFPLFASLIALLALVSAAPMASAKPLNIKVTQFTLDNGMQVVVIPDHRAPVVTHMVWYKVGSADEEKGKSGLAHFLEHLLFKGTKKIKSGEFSKIVSRNGGQDNAFTHLDYTGYHQRISRDRLELVMEMEADRMQNLVLTDKDVLPEREVVREERRTRTDNRPNRLLTEQMYAALYTAHPYGIPIIGWMSEVSQLTREDALAFYKKHYTPANAILVVAGDVTADEVKKLAQKHYGVLKNTFTPTPRMRTPEPDPIAARRVILRDKRVSAPNLTRVYLAPTYARATAREAYALSVLEEILGSGPTSRMYQQLVVKEKIAVSAGAWFSGGNMDYGSFGVWAVPKNPDDMAKLEARVDAMLADVIENGVTDDELKRTKRSMQADAIYALDSQRSMANIFGRALVVGRKVEDILNWPDHIEAVTAEDVRKAARKYIQLRRSVTGLLLKPLPAPNANKKAQN